MNLLYIHRTQGGGVERVHIDGICNGMQAQGFKVTEISPASNKQPKGPDSKGALSKEKSTTHGLVSRISELTPEWLFEMIELFYNLVALYKALRSGCKKPDFVYERYAIFSFAGVVISRLRSCPFVLECNYTALNPLVRQRTKLFMPLARWVDRWVISRADVVVCVSSTIKRQIAEHYGVTGDHIIIQPNASQLPSCEHIDKETIPGIKPQHKVIGFVGGFYPWHGLPLLIDAFLIAIKQEPNARLLLIGDGPERLLAETLLQQQSAQDKVIFTGKIPHQQLDSYLRHFSIGVMPDSNDYGSPMKIFEYMAHGIPVVAPDYPPISDVFNGQGICFKKKDVNSFATALLQLLGDQKLCRQQGIQGSALIKQQHNWQANANQTLRALESINGQNYQNNRVPQ